MAILTKGIFGPISGKLGNLVFCICVDGTNYVRTRPKKSKKTPTEAQMAQRTKLAMAAKFLRPIKEILMKGFNKKHLKNSTGFYQAMSVLIKGGIIGEYPDFKINFPMVQISTGTLQPLSAMVVQRMNSNVIVLNWVSLTNKYNSFAEDAVQIIVYNATQKRFVIEEAGQRKDEVRVLKMACAKPQDHLVFYAFTEASSGDTCGQFIGECFF